MPRPDCLLPQSGHSICSSVRQFSDHVNFDTGTAYAVTRLCPEGGLRLVWFDLVWSCLAEESILHDAAPEITLLIQMQT